MTIEELRNSLLETLNSMNRDKLSLPDLKLYADILKTISEIQTKSYFETLTDTMCSAVGYGLKSPTISDLK